MKQILTHPFTKYFLIAAYGLMVGFSINYGLIWVVPGLHWIPWPFSTFPTEIIGAFISALIVFFIFEKWQTTEIKKIITAIILLVILATLGGLYQGWMLYQMKVRAIEAMSLLPFLTPWS